MALKTLPWPTKTGLTTKQPIRMVKMIVPRCDVCPKVPGWSQNCRHNPLFGFETQTDERAQMKFNDETGAWEQELVQTVKGFVLRPNVAQVPLTLRIASGMEVERYLEMGAKFPQDVQPVLPDGTPDPDYTGYAPMCEFENCYAPNPKVRTRHSSLGENRMIPVQRQEAAYCTENHARLARQKDSEKSRREILDDGKRIEELAAIAL